MVSINLGSKLGENLILNPLFDLWQRGSSFVSIANGAYGPDRFLYAKVGTMVHDLNKSTDIPANSLATYSAFLNVTTAQPLLGVADASLFEQRIEGYNLRKIKGKYFFLSFLVKASKIGTYCVSFRNGAANRSYVAEYTVNQANTWEKKSIRVKFDSTGTWAYDNSIGMMVSFVQAAGTSFQTTAGSWQAGNFLSTVNQVNAVDAINNEFRVTQVQLHEGIDEIPFSEILRDIETEIELCQRYYEKSYELDVKHGTITSVGFTRETDTNSDFRTTVVFKVRKRAIPIPKMYSYTTGSVDTMNTNSGDVAVTYSGVGTVSFEVLSNIAATHRGWHWTADSEL